MTDLTKELSQEIRLKLANEAKEKRKRERAKSTYAKRIAENKKRLDDILSERENKRINAEHGLSF